MSGLAAENGVSAERMAPPVPPLLAFWRDFRRNKGAVAGLFVILVLCFAALFADWLAPHPPAEQYRNALLMPPAWADGGSLRFLLGTDDVGRDMLSRLIHGARVSMVVGISVVALGLVIGVALGLLAGFFPGVIDIAIMRTMDTLLALPALYQPAVMATRGA